MKFELPKRTKQHKSESASYKLLQSKVPENWIIREITERDYGIDCYIELVNENDELSGDLVLIQLKSKQKIHWTKNEKYTLTGINISTSNYWYKFAVPVFVFLADLELQEIYFKPVDYSIRRNFSEFIEQKKFNYEFRKSDLFNGKDGLFAFRFYYYFEKYRQQFENEILFFLTNLNHFINFQSQHSNRDFHLGIEEHDLIFFESMHRNYKFLCTYLDIENLIPSVRELKIKSKEKFKTNYYDLFEHDLMEWINEFDKLTKLIIVKMKIFLGGESSYWMVFNPSLYNYIQNLNPDKLESLD